MAAKLEPKPRRTTFAAQKRRAVPSTRQEADELYGKGRVTGPASGAQLYRLSKLGMLEIRSEPGAPITRGEAHQTMLATMYDEHGMLRDVPDQAVRAQPVHETGD